jgi:hypothetical protein
MILKACLQCGKIMPRTSNEAVSRYAERKFCSRTCFAIWLQFDPIIEGHNCQVCDKVLVRVRGEKLDRFQARLWCDRECKAVYRKAHPLTLSDRRKPILPAESKHSMRGKWPADMHFEDHPGAR